ncbi:MAG: zinc-ribbon domain-containing protein [Actinomycetota bacterium]
MLVCPNCRAENLEGASVCRHCGNGLDATSSPMRRQAERSMEEEPQLDLMPARRTSAWPLVIAGLVVGLILLGWGLFAALRPNPCAGKYSSVLYAYCAEIPEGWAGGSRFQPEGPLDRYQRLGADGAEPGGAETTVEVNMVLDPTVSTQQYAQQFRTSQEADGLNPSDPEVVLIDGEQAVAWDFASPTGPQGESSLHVRDVITVRPDGAWQIRFIATEESYEEARLAFEEMLASWRWKA